MPLVFEDRDDRALLDEARRQMTVCVVCKYCNGYCPVFRAADARPALTDADLLYLANLCHDCRSCWHACQYRPPHAFAIALPAALARVRALSWRRMARFHPGKGGPGGHGWGLSPLTPPLGGKPPKPSLSFKVKEKGRAGGIASRRVRAAAQSVRMAYNHSGSRRTALLALACTLLVPLATLVLVPWEVLFAPHHGPGAFHAVIPRGPMVWGAALALLLPLAWVGVPMARFWRAIGGGSPGQILRALPRALGDVLALRHLDGGGLGCNDRNGRFSPWRRRMHHLILYGFLLTVAATLSAAIAHHLLGMRAPYPWLSAPVLLGTAGGMSLLAGVIGMAVLRARADPAPQAPETRADGALLLTLLGATAASGLALLGWRETAAMGMLLALHLGTVLALFVTLPFGRLMHAPFRALAILRAVIERQTTRHREDS